MRLGEVVIFLTFVSATCSFLLEPPGAVRAVYFGGTLSFSVKFNNSTNKPEAQMDFLIGYLLNSGPCGSSCTDQDIGKNTSGGNYEVTWQRGSTDVGNEVKASSQSQVFAVDTVSMNKWELEWWRSKIPLFDGSQIETIIVGGLRFPAALVANTFRMKVEIDWSLRNDTNMPNRSPIVLVKPVYRVANGKSQIYIAAIDPDGDFVKCEDGVSTEHGHLATDGRAGITVNADCIVDLDSSQVSGGPLIGLGINVRDFAKKTIKLGSSEVGAYELSLSKTPVQFLVEFSASNIGPIFVKPTMADNQKFTVYIGASLSTPLCVQTAINTSVNEFRIIEREGLSFQPLVIHNDDSRANTQCATFSWTPTTSDVGSHIVCIIARDNHGNETPQDKCFLIEIKEADYNGSSSAASTFVDFPKSLQTDSKTAVVLPISVYSATGQPNIDSTTTDLSYTSSEIYASLTLPNIYTKSFTLYQEDFGNKTICFMAGNGLHNEEKCLDVQVLPPDPCISMPCKNGGKCQRKPGVEVDFVCSCPSVFTGKDCTSKAHDACDPNPCIHGERCLSHASRIACLCHRGNYGGTFCEIDLDSCKTASCGHGVCMDKEIGFSCLCYPGYTGQHCETDICALNARDSRCTAITCLYNSSDPLCSCGQCHNGGVCRDGHCACPTGYTGASCDTPFSMHTTGITFVPPTLEEGTTLICYFQGDILQPCHMMIAVTTEHVPLHKPVVSRASGTLKTDSTVSSFTCNHQSNVHVCTSGISIKGTKADGLNFICINVSEQASTAERCFGLHYKRDHQDATDTFEYAQKDKAIKFEDPTPNARSQLSCYVRDQCRLVLYTTKDGSTCQTIRTTSMDVSIFPTNDMDGICQTEVMFTYSTPSSTPEEICFLSGLSDSTSQTRCYFMNVQPRGSDPCDTKPCQNGGMCIKTGTTGYFCICDKGFSGANCEKGMCIDDTYCVHGQCAIFDLITSCLCDIGYTGDKCDVEIQSYVGDAYANGALFTDMAIPKMLPCVIGLHCSMYLVLSGQLPSGRPVLKMGYVDPAVAVDQITIKPNNTLGSFRAEIVVSSKKIGDHIVCVQTFNSQGVNKDELCTNFNVTADAMNLFGDQTVPHFLEPSLQPEAVTRCAVNTTCHVWYTYTPGPNDKADIDLSNDALKASLTRTECLTISTAENKCSLDISLRPRSDEVGKTFKICVSLSVMGANTKGESRCFTVEVVHESDLDNQRKCRQQQCEHNGFCDGHGFAPVCYCPQGVEGSMCELEYRPNLAGKLFTFVGDNAMPKALVCKVNQLCYIPFHLFSNHGRCSPPLIRAGYRSSGVDFVKSSMTSVQEGNLSRNFTGSVVLMPTQTGLQHFCLQAVDNGTTLTEFCFELSVKGPTTENMKRPYFVEPTYLSGSTLYCEESRECHFTLHYTRGEQFNSEQECPSVLDTSPQEHSHPHSFSHLLRTFKTEDKCYNEILFRASVAGSTTTLCYQLSLPRNIGEERCFYIEVVNYLSAQEKTPCNGIDCSPWQVCISNLISTVPPQYTCVNATKYVPKAVQDSAMFVDLPPNTESLHMGCLHGMKTVPLYVLSPTHEITSVEVARGQNESVFTINQPNLECHNYVEVYRANLIVAADKLDPDQALCIVAKDLQGIASDVTCINPKPSSADKTSPLT